MNIPTRVVSSLPAGTAVGRYLQAKMMGLSDGLAKAREWRDSPQVAFCLEAETEWYTKAGVDPMTTSDVGAAAPLAQSGIATEFLGLLRGKAPAPQLIPRGMRVVPWNVSVPRETGAGVGGSWIAEAAPMPVVNNAFSTTTQSLYKMGALVVLSKELTRAPQAEAVILNTVVSGVADFEGQQFLDPSISLIAHQRPASITSGATAITSTGGTAAQIVADLAAMIQAITTAGNGLTWIMRPTTAYTIAARLAGVGMSTDLPRSLLGIPAILTASAPARQITLVDAEGILYSVNDSQMDIQITDRATVEMSNVPTSPPTASTILVALWTSNLIGVKVIRWESWQRAVPGSVSYLTTSY
jgi:HK97 family phage major capsid protein